MMQCEYCHENKATTRDHVIPRSAGGKGDRLNIALVCEPCNAAKSHLLPCDERWHDDPIRHDITQDVLFRLAILYDLGIDIPASLMRIVSDLDALIAAREDEIDAATDRLFAELNAPRFPVPKLADDVPVDWQWVHAEDIPIRKRLRQRTPDEIKKAIHQNMEKRKKQRKNQIDRAEKNKKIKEHSSEKYDHMLSFRIIR